MKVTQSCLTLCDPMDYTVHGILQARILEWVAFPFSRESSQPRSPALRGDLYQLSHKGSGDILNLCSHLGKYNLLFIGSTSMQCHKNKSDIFLLEMLGVGEHNHYL